MSVSWTESRLDLKPIIPVEAFLQLENMVQDIRLWVINRVDGKSETEQRASIKSILKKIAESPILLSGNAPPEKPADARLLLDSYLFLESRLHNLRVLVMRTAASMTGVDYQNKVTSDLLKAAWDHILSTDYLLQNALLSESNHSK